MSDPSRLLRGFTPAMALLCVVTLFSSSLVAQEDVSEAAPKKPSMSEVASHVLLESAKPADSQLPPTKQSGALA